MGTKLVKFRVQNFRSITDSGWIESFENTCLIGTNESGKTNLLLGLWKLNPASGEQIIPLIDYPRKRFVDYEKTKGEEIFISGYFNLDANGEKQIRNIFFKQTDSANEGEQTSIVNDAEIDNIILHRKYNGEYLMEFPNISKTIPLTTENSNVILNIIPKFVYYSDYGNLDSEIYLPHVIANFQRHDLGENERAKVRSLKVLFEFVQLSADEILKLGQEKKETETIVRINHYGQEAGRETKKIEPTESEIENERKQKTKREILLQSASNKLTDDFREFWKQGNYRFRFQADGNYFKIWVSDDKRSEEIELGGRSKGLQWFFSFFLVFLVESKDSHSNCILLLDEPGLSLHPVAQFDLIDFFESLAEKNQIIYSTHSPFLVNPDNLANVKAVFVDEKGASSVSSDLRRNSKVADKSIYPVHAAIGLTISDTLLLGCQPVLVEGISDQIYLQILKNHLLDLGKYRNSKEMVFIPTGGVRGVSAVTSIVAGRDNTLPFVLLDSDKPGKEKAVKLKSDTYKQSPDRVIEIDAILNKKGEFELEDIFPSEELGKVFGKRYRGQNDDFEYIVVAGKPIVPQMEDFAKNNGHVLQLGWKVELATDFFNQFHNISKKIQKESIEIWTKLFDQLAKK